MSRMQNLGPEKRRIAMSLRGRGMLRFLGLPLNPSPPLPMPFFPFNNKHPSLEPVPRIPTARVFSVPNTAHPYSSSTPLAYGSRASSVFGRLRLAARKSNA